MSNHVPDDLLHAFTEGDLGEEVAVAVALHLDACPACTNRAVALEPLVSAFAAVHDPPVPDGIPEQVLHTLATPEPSPLPELLLGGGLLAAAALLSLGADPVPALVDLGRIGLLAAKIGTSVAQPLADQPVVWMFTLSLATVTTLLGFRVALPQGRPA